MTLLTDLLHLVSELAEHTVALGAFLNILFWLVAMIFVVRHKHQRTIDAVDLLSIGSFIVIDFIVIVVFTNVVRLGRDMAVVLLGFAIGMQTVAALGTIVAVRRRPPS